jgi:hypothetical protein
MGNGGTETGASINDWLGVDDSIDHEAARRALTGVAAELLDVLVCLPANDIAIPAWSGLWPVPPPTWYAPFAAAAEGRLDGWGTPAADAVLSSLAVVPDQDSQALARQLGDAINALLSTSTRSGISQRRSGS